MLLLRAKPYLRASHLDQLRARFAPSGCLVRETAVMEHVRAATGTAVLDGQVMQSYQAAQDIRSRQRAEEELERGIAAAFAQAVADIERHRPQIADQLWIRLRDLHRLSHPVVDISPAKARNYQYSCTLDYGYRWAGQAVDVIDAEPRSLFGVGLPIKRSELEWAIGRPLRSGVIAIDADEIVVAHVPPDPIVWAGPGQKEPLGSLSHSEFVALTAHLRRSWSDHEARAESRRPAHDGALAAYEGELALNAR